MSRGVSPVCAGSGQRPLLSQAELNIVDKSRTNLFAWRGQFSPQLVEARLKAYASAGDTVLDLDEALERAGEVAPSPVLQAAG